MPEASSVCDESSASSILLQVVTFAHSARLVIRSSYRSDDLRVKPQAGLRRPLIRRADAEETSVGARVSKGVDSLLPPTT